MRAVVMYETGETRLVDVFDPAPEELDLGDVDKPPEFEVIFHKPLQSGIHRSAKKRLFRKVSQEGPMLMYEEIGRPTVREV